MKITVVGSGYVGLVTGTCFAEMGNSVTCVDIDQGKIDGLNKGIIPIYEPGLEEMIRGNVERDNLKFSIDLQSALEHCSIAFIAVGTPMDEDGSADLQHVISVARSIGQVMSDDLVVVDKSTVPVGTAEKVKKAIADELEKRDVELEFHVVSNPEFLKEGAAIEDFMKPDRVVVGTENLKAQDIMKELYRPFTLSRERFVHMDVRSAEMTKYAANAMLATKISFMNEIASICEKVGANVNHVRRGIGSDSRIGFSFIYPGIGYGGSCFPKDVNALIRTAEDFGANPLIIKAVTDVNQNQRKIFLERIQDHFSDGLAGKTFAVWGLSFKPETDDMREAPSVTVINHLLKAGAAVQAYDPQAMDEAKKHYFSELEGLKYCTSKYDALNGASALLLLTEWKEFRSPDFDEIQQRLKNSVIFDGRNQYSAKMLGSRGITYFQVGVTSD